MTLEELKKSVQDMTDEELKACILQERAERRNSSRNVKLQKEKESTASNMSEQDIEDLLNLLED